MDVSTAALALVALELIFSGIAILGLHFLGLKIKSLTGKIVIAYLLVHIVLLGAKDPLNTGNAVWDFISFHIIVKFMVSLLFVLPMLGKKWLTATCILMAQLYLFFRSSCPQ
jgi:hypothetical protein